MFEICYFIRVGVCSSLTFAAQYSFFQFLPKGQTYVLSENNVTIHAHSHIYAYTRTLTHTTSGDFRTFSHACTYTLSAAFTDSFLTISGNVSPVVSNSVQLTSCILTHVPLSRQSAKKHAPIKRLPRI